MDTFIDSSWYWYRYLSPHKPDGPLDADMVETWTPVEQYTGGAEHAVMHLLYAREFTKMMRDLGLVQQNEPWKRVFNQGQILGADGERMSKSRGNVQDPDELVARYGADTVRLFLMFMGPWDQGGPWSPTGIGGVHRFLNRVWTIALDPHGVEPGDPDVRDAAGRRDRGRRPGRRCAPPPTARCATSPTTTRRFRFNTMLAKLMELSNTLMRYRGTAVAGSAEWDEAVRLLLLMLAPAAPHITEELWSRRLAASGERVVVDPRRALAGGRHVASWPRRRARSRSRSTASCATGWSCRPTRRRPSSSGSPWPARRSRGSWRVALRTRSSPPVAASSSTSSSATPETHRHGGALQEDRVPPIKLGALCWNQYTDWPSLLAAGSAPTGSATTRSGRGTTSTRSSASHDGPDLRGLADAHGLGRRRPSGSGSG